MHLALSTKHLSVYCDGGSRGNPGPAACAFVIYQNGKIFYQLGTYLGIATNNQAEYQAVLEALKYLSTSHLHEERTKGSILSTINFFLDSELVVKQLNGLYKIKDEKLKIKYLEIKKLIGHLSFDICHFVHISREKNSPADLLVNQTLDNTSALS